jgi:hypothetical protein
MALLPLCVCGCGEPLKVMCEASPLHRDAGGTVVAGKAVGPVAAFVRVGIVVQHEGKKVNVRLTAIGDEEARFRVIYPDGTDEEVSLRFGQTQDLFPVGKEMGARVRLYAKRPWQ